MQPSQYWLTGILTVILLVPLGAPAQQKLQPARSDIAFTSRQMNVPVEGRFARFDAQVNFDPRQPQAARIAFDVDLNSVAIGDAETARELKQGSWFDTAKFPKAQFQSTSVKALGAGRFEVLGNLSIKGVSRPVVVPVTLTQQAGETVAVGSFVIKRLDFRIGEGDWSDVSVVANDVQVRLRLVLTGVARL